MKIGIIGAMDVEIERFNDLFNLTEVEKDIYEGNNVVVALSGIGKVNSAAITQHLIDKYNVKYIINTGCAGSLTDSVNVFDVVLASSVIYHDFNPERIMNISMPNNGIVEADKKLIELAKDTIKNHNVLVGKIASGDCFVTSSEQRDDIYNRTHALAVDMESASIGHIACKNNIPFLIVRTISDFADGAVDFEKEAGNISSNLVKNIVEKIEN